MRMSKKSNKKSVDEDLIDLMIDDDFENLSSSVKVEEDSFDPDRDIEDVRFDQGSSGEDDKTAVLQAEPPDNFNNDNKTQVISEDQGSSAKHGRRDLEIEDVSSSTETKVSYGVSSSMPPEKTVAPTGGASGGAIFTSAEATLKQSEHLRVAQARVNELETEIERLRRENEQLAAAGETFQRLKDEYYSKVEALELDREEERKLHADELRLAKERLSAKERESFDLQRKIEELEMRLETNIRKIRKREKDLEHRLEIAKMEEIALVRSKDEMILELKRRIDRLKVESENYNKKSQQIYKQLQEKHEVTRRVIRALRIALTQLEGDEDSVVPFKKVE